MPRFDDLIVPALGALASSPAGTMTVADLEAHLETRFGSTEESAGDARSVDSTVFRETFEHMLSPEQPESLAAQGFVTGGIADGRITITPEGRAFIGRN